MLWSFGDWGMSLTPTWISYLNGFLNLIESECSSNIPLYIILGSKGTGGSPEPLSSKAQSPIYFDLTVMIPVYSLSKEAGMY